MSIPWQASVWDDHRNTSQVFEVPVGASKDAIRACRSWAETNPAHAQWIADGYPTLSEAEHLERFGEPYKKKAKRAEIVEL